MLGNTLLCMQADVCPVLWIRIYCNLGVKLFVAKHSALRCHVRSGKVAYILRSTERHSNNNMKNATQSRKAFRVLHLGILFKRVKFATKINLLKNSISAEVQCYMSSPPYNELNTLGLIGINHSVKHHRLVLLTYNNYVVCWFFPYSIALVLHSPLIFSIKHQRLLQYDERT